jgi:hypothetical protein
MLSLHSCYASYNQLVIVLNIGLSILLLKYLIIIMLYRQLKFYILRKNYVKRFIIEILLHLIYLY